MNGKAVALLGAKLLLSVGLLGPVLARVDPASIFEVLRKADPWLVAFWYALVPVSMALAAWRWEILAPGLSYGTALKYTWIGVFFGHVLPGSIAGDIAKGVSLALKDSSARSGLAASIVAEKVIGLAALSAVFVVIFVLELMTGGKVRRYFTRNFRTDMLYGMFYRGGVYNALIYVPLVAGFAAILPDFELQLLRHLPQPLDFVMFWFIADAAGYWIHRWYHSNPILWQFHSVHHAQTELTFVTSFRNHVVEQIVSNVVLFVPMKILGFPLWYWAPIIFIQSLFEALQHSDLNWKFGKLYPILVSPVFHAIHHSPDQARHDSNYGKILSLWDYLFGTISFGERPVRYGLADVEMPISFTGTMLAPFKELWKRSQRSLHRLGSRSG